MLFYDACADLLTAAPRHGRWLYLLADAAARPGLAHRQALQWTGPAIDLLTLAEPHWSQTAAPVLLEAPRQPFSALQLARWRRFGGDMQYANALTLIESELRLEALAGKLAERLRVQLADGSSMLLRLFDNRILLALLSVLSTPQVDALLAPGSAWHFAARDGANHVARRPGDRDAAPVSPYRLQLSSDQEERLLKLSEPDSITGMLLQQGNAALMAMRPHEQHAAVASQLQAASEWDIDQPADRAAFVALGLQLGEGFDKRAPWAEALDAARGRRQPFRAALAEALERT